MAMPTTRNRRNSGGKLGGWKPWSVPKQGSGREGESGGMLPSGKFYFWVFRRGRKKLPLAMKFANLYFLQI